MLFVYYLITVNVYNLVYLINLVCKNNETVKEDSKIVILSTLGSIKISQLIGLVEDLTPLYLDLKYR